MTSLPFPVPVGLLYLWRYEMNRLLCFALHLSTPLQFSTGSTDRPLLAQRQWPLGPVKCRHNDSDAYLAYDFALAWLSDQPLYCVSIQNILQLEKLRYVAAHPHKAERKGICVWFFFFNCVHTFAVFLDCLLCLFTYLVKGCLIKTEQFSYVFGGLS